MDWHLTWTSGIASQAIIANSALGAFGPRICGGAKVQTTDGQGCLASTQTSPSHKRRPLDWEYYMIDHTDRSLSRAEIDRKDRTRTRRQNETPPDGDRDASKGTNE